MRRAAIVLALLLTASGAAADDPSVLRVTPTWPAHWPMDPAPLTSARWPALPPPLPPRPPATDAAARVLATLAQIERAQRDAAYQHRTDVNERAGRYRWDCSGLVSWVVRRAAPRAGRAMGGERLTARGIHRMIERAPRDRARAGWQRLGHIEEVLPGDVFAWRTPPGSPSRHTGHTGFVVERPRRVEGLRDAYAVRVADSIVGPHEDDSRAEGTAGGLGTGVFVFLTDGEGQATHYGWHGTRTAGYVRTPVLFGRLWH
ncbi:MAG: CHAP domain-containing protein [Sandaracinaceae bacterium]|nr:CHAP domain-containing protein [Sandaracinaceae bacterium]